MKDWTVDAAVVGAGTAGLAAAYHLATAGFRVALVDRVPFERSGARWVNAIASWLYAETGIKASSGDECRGANGPVTLRDRNWNIHLAFDHVDVHRVDMRRLVERLHALCVDAGVLALPEHAIDELEFDNGRPTALRLRHRRADGGMEGVRVRAALFVDATGRRQALARLHPRYTEYWPPVPLSDTCTATQRVFHISDPDGARAFLERVRLQDGEAANLLGIDGGFSTVTMTVEIERGQIEILAGSIADGQHRTGAQLIREFVSGEQWIGPALFGGGGLIPLGRPYDRLTAPGFALVGDSGCQSFPAHGSGIGSGMAAGRMLAEALRGASDIGAPETLWRYQARFARRMGGLHAAFDVFRRFAQSLTSDELVTLLSSGLTQPSSALAGMIQEMPRPVARELVPALRALAKNRGLARRVIPTVARMSALHAWYRRYPAEMNESALARWSRFASRLANEHNESPALPPA